MVLGLMVSPVYAAEAKADSDVTVIEFSDGFTIEISTSTSYNFRAWTPKGTTYRACCQPQAVAQ